MKSLILILKGFLIGMAKIIPGVSGAVLSISLGIYEKILNIISHPLKIKAQDLKFLTLLLIGASIGVLFFCWGIQWCLDKWKFATMLLFIGFICGGMPEITNETKKLNIKNITILIISFITIIFLTNLSEKSGDSTHYFLMGTIESLTTIIPGISGTAIFMALGWYESVLETIHSILTFSCELKIFIYYFSGFIISTLLIAKLLNFLFKNYKTQMYFSVLGFMSGSITTMMINLIKITCNITEFILGIILFILGYIMTEKINSFFSKL